VPFGQVRVPEDVALIGWDDVMFAMATVAPLPSVRQPSALIGSTAIELLLDQEPRQMRFQPELAVRESTTSPTDGRTHPKSRARPRSK
jgi:LacI family transcriptional regulator